MKLKNDKCIDKFDPSVLKNMILFSIKSKRAYTFSEDILSYESNSTVYEFIVEFFLEEIRKIILNKPYKKYNEYNENLYFVKGKINLRDMSMKMYNKINCTYGELSLNNKLNQIVKYILYYLIRDEELRKNHKLKRKITSIYNYFEEVELIKASIKDILDIRLNKNNINYETLIILSRYLLGCIKENVQTSEKYIDIDSELWWIYQEFIRNYYDYYKDKLSIKKVQPSKYEWNLISIDNSDIELIPKMRTDIEIETKTQHLIIDAKCYENSLREFFGKKILDSGNLYQLKSYLDIYKLGKNDNRILRGILVYPYNDNSRLNAGRQVYYDKDNDYYIEISNINFKKSWNEICNELNNLLEIPTKS